MRNNSCIVLLSGGQDSTTALFWAKKRFKKTIALSFDYEQRHKIELKAAKKIAKLAKVKHKIIKINEYKDIKYSALLDKKYSVLKKHKIDKNLPATFVPGRNMLFLVIAASFAYSMKIDNLVIGVSQVDYSGYPDCRKIFINAIQKAISFGLNKKFKIFTPLMNKNKKQIVLMAKKLKILNILKYTHTCYTGSKKSCGKCSACRLREKGFLEAGIKDPIV